MIVDSSAVVAIAKREIHTDRLIEALGSAPQVGMVTPVWLESSMVLWRSGVGRPKEYLEWFGLEFRVESIAFTAEHGRAALEAWHRFGKGNHPARLNFGDCISYAAAKITGRPLLFVGRDFSKTDIVPALEAT